MTEETHNIVNHKIKETFSGHTIYDGFGILDRGIIEGIYWITNDEYHGSEGISKSGIVKVLQSPKHYWANYLDPDREKTDFSAGHFVIGSASHKYVLEPNTFFEEYVVLSTELSSMSKNRKDYKEAVIKYKEQGLTALTLKMMKVPVNVRNSVVAHEKANELVTDGRAEMSFYWIDEDTGVLCKCRPDYWIPNIAVPDLKTTATDARADAFSKTCASYDYHIQAAFYSDGVAALTNEKLDMPFIAVEKEPPYACAVYTIDQFGVNKGRSDYKRALETFSRCLELDDWPSYPPKVTTISLPHWKK